MKLEPLDLPPERAERRLGRARRVFGREAALARAPWLLRAEARFGRAVEPWLAAVGAVGMLLWAARVVVG